MTLEVIIAIAVVAVRAVTFAIAVRDLEARVVACPVDIILGLLGLPSMT